VAETAHTQREGDPLSVAMLAPPWIPIPPPGYGGVDQVIDLLAAELIRRGHSVTLFAAPETRSTLGPSRAPTSTPTAR